MDLKHFLSVDVYHPSFIYITLLDLNELSFT